VDAAIAAGHPATVEAGVEVLAEGGSAADAAVAASLASCVAETVMTGLLGGGHAIYFDAGSRRTRNLDCFVAVPGLGGKATAAELVELQQYQAQRTPITATAIQYWNSGPATLRWTQMTLSLIQRDKLNPVRAARLLGVVHTAMADAVVARASSDPAFGARVDDAVRHILAAKDTSGLLPCSGG